MQPHRSEIDLDEAFRAYQTLPMQHDSLIMATVNKDGMPNASYAVYIRDRHDYYVFISELATHTGNIAETGRVSVLFIENETQARHLFARRRVTLQCTASKIEHDCDLYRRIMKLFTDKFGSFMQLLENKQDFHLFRIRPLSGAYVAGFGRAFAIDGEQLGRIRHLGNGENTHTGHRDTDTPSKSQQQTN